MAERTSTTRLVIYTAIGAAVVAAAVTALLVTIVERQQEARNPFYRVVDLDDETEDPAVWGQNFPQQYDTYRRTVDQVRTRYGGSEAMPRTPTDADPRSIVAQSRLEDDPRLKTMWAGYPFAVDFREERGHAYMLDDQTYTERQRVVSQPGTCIHCHASVYVPYKRLGDGDLTRGFELMNQMPFMEARKLVTHPVTCIDCHAPDTMELRITRPGFMEGMRAWKASQGVPDYDVNRMATRQEMRAFVCGQCHVEYYFSGPEKRLVYPWAKGLKADEILSYYQESGFATGCMRDRGAGAEGAASRVRDVEPGHPRQVGRDVRRLPHAVPARGRDEDQRSPRAEPAAQHQPCLPDLSQVVGRGPGGARAHDSGSDLSDPQPGDRRARGVHRRHPDGARRRCH
jgi:nitrite reductase (cytochrome c-552)